MSSKEVSMQDFVWERSDVNEEDFGVSDEFDANWPEDLNEGE